MQSPSDDDDEGHPDPGGFFHSAGWRALVFVCRLAVPAIVLLAILFVILDPNKVIGYSLARLAAQATVRH